MRRAPSLALAALLLAAPAGAETIEVRPELAFQGSAPFRTAVTAHPGDTIRIDLPAQAGSGYEWRTTVEGEAVQPGRTEARPAERPGGPTRQIQLYVPVAFGKARLTFAYQRAWETARPPARQVIVDVSVTEAPPAAPGAPPPAAPPPGP